MGLGVLHSQHFFLIGSSIPTERHECIFGYHFEKECAKKYLSSWLLEKEYAE